MKGGGQENDVLEWWKEKQAVRKKKELERSANAASKDFMKDKDDNYAPITITAAATSHVEGDEEFAFVVTSGHNHLAYAVSTSTSIIINCGASSYFFPDQLKFLNYEDINPEPIKAANGCTFSAIGKGDVCVTFPTCKSIEPVTVHLKSVYCAPAMAFTLILVSCLDHAGFSLLIEDKVCII